MTRVVIDRLVLIGVEVSANQAESLKERIAAALRQALEARPLPEGLAAAERLYAPALERSAESDLPRAVAQRVCQALEGNK